MEPITVLGDILAGGRLSHCPYHRTATLRNACIVVSNSGRLRASMVAGSVRSARPRWDGVLCALGTRLASHSGRLTQ
jgi:hypothetical protein